MEKTSLNHRSTGGWSDVLGQISFDSAHSVGAATEFLVQYEKTAVNVHESAALASCLGKLCAFVASSGLDASLIQTSVGCCRASEVIMKALAGMTIESRGPAGAAAVGALCTYAQALLESAPHLMDACKLVFLSEQWVEIVGKSKVDEASQHLRAVVKDLLPAALGAAVRAGAELAKEPAAPASTVSRLSGIVVDAICVVFERQLELGQSTVQGQRAGGGAGAGAFPSFAVLNALWMGLTKLQTNGQHVSSAPWLANMERLTLACADHSETAWRAAAQDRFNDRDTKVAKFWLQNVPKGCQLYPAVSAAVAPRLAELAMLCLGDVSLFRPDTVQLAAKPESIHDLRDTAVAKVTAAVALCLTHAPPSTAEVLLGMMVRGMKAEGPGRVGALSLGLQLLKTFAKLDPARSLPAAHRLLPSCLEAAALHAATAGRALSSPQAHDSALRALLQFFIIAGRKRDEELWAAGLRALLQASLAPGTRSSPLLGDVWASLAALGDAGSRRGMVQMLVGVAERAAAASGPEPSSLLTHVATLLARVTGSIRALTPPQGPMGPPEAHWVDGEVFGALTLATPHMGREGGAGGISAPAALLWSSLLSSGALQLSRCPPQALAPTMDMLCHAAQAWLAEPQPQSGPGQAAASASAPRPALVSALLSQCAASASSAPPDPSNPTAPPFLHLPPWCPLPLIADVVIAAANAALSPASTPHTAAKAWSVLAAYFSGLAEDAVDLPGAEHILPGLLSSPALPKWAGEPACAPWVAALLPSLFAAAQRRPDLPLEALTAACGVLLALPPGPSGSEGAATACHAAAYLATVVANSPEYTGTTLVGAVPGGAERKEKVQHALKSILSLDAAPGPSQPPLPLSRLMAVGEREGRETEAALTAMAAAASRAGTSAQPQAQRGPSPAGVSGREADSALQEAIQLALPPLERLREALSSRGPSPYGSHGQLQGAGVHAYGPGGLGSGGIARLGALLHECLSNMPNS